ncbi:MAG: hypothetical protein ACOY0T_17450 [Myxococcota bacterium]
MSRLVGLDDGARGGSDPISGIGEDGRVENGAVSGAAPNVGESEFGSGGTDERGNGGGTDELGRGGEDEVGSGGGDDRFVPDRRDEGAAFSSQPASRASSSGLGARLGRCDEELAETALTEDGAPSLLGTRGARGIAGTAAGGALLAFAGISPTGGGGTVASMRSGEPHALHEIVTTRPRNLFS